MEVQKEDCVDRVVVKARVVCVEVGKALEDVASAAVVVTAKSSGEEKEGEVVVETVQVDLDRWWG